MGIDFNSLNCQSWANLGASYAIADDRSTAIWSDYGNGGTPRNVIIDSEGIVRYNSSGFNANTINTVLNELLGATSTGEEIEVPQSPVLMSNYPNPFNAGTQIDFEIHVSGPVELIIYNTRGVPVKSLVSSELAAGSHSVNWNARNNQNQNLPSGIYMASLRSVAGKTSQKLLLLK